jgi:hypothetical protein
MRLPLEELASRLPRRSESERLTEEEHQPAFSAVVTEVGGYVWPDLTLDNDDAEVSSGSSVLLVRAPGAMGKTAAARAMASRLRCPLVDLSKLRVGSNGLTGLLTHVLGWQQAPAFIQALQAGEASLVLDSTDEAQLAAGQDNFLAFLQDISGLMKGAKAKSQLLVFGRPDATTTTYLGLAEFGLEPGVAEIAPLSHAQSSELIDRVLDAKVTSTGSYDVHRVHPEPFGRLRDRSFVGIARALQPGVDESNYWTRTEPFLGYPPVLMALAERLAVDNPQAEAALASRTEGAGRRRQGELLRQVVEDILDRESGKVRLAVAEALHFSPGDPRCGVIYSRDEQCLRLVERVSGSPLAIQAPASLQPLERSTYEDLVAHFTADHPFLRDDSFANAVFADYVRAFLATAPLSEAHGLSRDSLLAAVPQAGPFFAHFVHDLAGAGTEEGATVAEDLVDDLISSYAGGAAGARSTFTQSEEKAVLTLYGTGDGEESGSIAYETLVFTVTDLSGVLTLTGPLVRCLVVTDRGLVVSGTNGNLAIGPDVALFAPDLEFAADTITVTGGTDQGHFRGVTLVISAHVTHEARLRVTAHPESALQVSWIKPWHQWKPYSFDLAERFADADPVTSSQVFLGLRRMLVSFGSATGNDPLVFAEKFDRFAIGGNAIFQATADALLDLGIIVRQGAVYRLRLQTLSEFGVVWAKLHGGDVASTLKQLHVEVMKHNAVRALRG